MHNWTIDDFELGKPIGYGKFGQVWLAQEKKRKYIVSLKIINRASMENEKLIKQLRREIDLHYNLNSKFVIQMYGHFFDKNNIYYILEYANSGDLYTYLQDKVRLTEKESALFIYQIARGLMDLHRYNIIHRDIKPENILMANKLLKIADLGWSVCNMDKKRETFCGTREYLAPEMKNLSGFYTAAVDIWCLGILLYEFLTGETPTPAPKIPKYISTECSNLLELLLKRDPAERPTAKEVVENSWIQSQIKNTFLEYY